MDAPDPTLADAHRAAIEEVCRWRGHCLDLFARIERATIDILDAMIVSGKMPGLRRAALFGARIETVRTALSGDAFKNTAKAIRAFEKLAPVLTRRNDIVHGVGKVFIDAKGDWLWQFTYRSNARTSSIVEGRLTKADATEVERILSTGARSLGDTLRHLACNIASP